MTLLVWTFDIDNATEIHALTKFIQKRTHHQIWRQLQPLYACVYTYCLMVEAGAHDWLLELFGVRVGGTG